MGKIVQERIERRRGRGENGKCYRGGEAQREGEVIWSERYKMKMKK